MALLDLLRSMVDPNQTANAVTSGQSAAPDAQSVDGVTVTGAGRRMPAPVNLTTAPPNGPGPMSSPPANPQLSGSPRLDYNNTADSNAVNSAVSAEGTPRGGMANPGIYGLLPQHMQHGTMRNVLGALGDALLVSGGRQPQYEERMQRQEIGQAMAGLDINNPDSVSAAAQRVAATGAAGSPEMSDKLTQQGEQAELRKQYMQYNQDYREQSIGVKNQNMLRQAAPQMQYYLSQAKNAADYKTRLGYIQSRVAAIDPALDATAELGVPSAEDWQPGSIGNEGMTANQGQQSIDRNTGFGVSMSNNRNSNAARISAARISAGRPSYPGIEQDIENTQDSGKPLSPGQQSYVDRHTPRGRIRHTGSAPISSDPTVAAGQTAGETLGAMTTRHAQFENGRVYTDAHGNHAMYMNGKWIPK